MNDSVAYFRDNFISFSDANVSIGSAPVLYGLSVYTVFPVFKNEKTQSLNIYRLRDHFLRLQNSAKILAFDDFISAWDYKKFEDKMLKLIQLNKIETDSLVRVSIFVDDILKGTRMHGLSHSLSAFVYPATQLLPKNGASLTVSSWRRTPDNSIPARAKINGSYVNAALMKHEAVMNGYDDAIALDEYGHVTESTVSNIFVVKNGIIYTPTDSTDLLEGITRDSVFRLANDLKIRSVQKPIDRSELYIADEIFLSGSSMSITPVIDVDKRKIGSGSVGIITKKLMKAYDESVRSENGKYQEWITTVR